jgi:hypothetical protein
MCRLVVGYGYWYGALKRWSILEGSHTLNRDRNWSSVVQARMAMNALSLARSRHQAFYLHWCCHHDSTTSLTNP